MRCLISQADIQSWGPLGIAAEYVFLEMTESTFAILTHNSEHSAGECFLRLGQTFWWNRHKKNHTNVRAHTYSAKHTPLTATVPHRVSIKPPMCNMHHHYTLYQGSSGEANQEKHSCILPPRLSFSLIEPTDMHKSQITTLQWKINSEVSWQYSNVKRSTSPAMIQQQ